jgi:hypothetical protein
MQRSTKDSWLSGGDLVEEEIENVPVPGESVRIKALAASFSGLVQEELNISLDGRQEVGSVNVSAYEALVFQRGVVDPQFSIEEVHQIQDLFGPKFRKVVNRINEISGIDEEAIRKADDRFPAGGAGPNGQGRGELGAESSAASGSGA